MKGMSEPLAILDAKAVLPVPGAPRNIEIKEKKQLGKPLFIYLNILIFLISFIKTKQYLKFGQDKPVEVKEFYRRVYNTIIGNFHEAEFTMVIDKQLAKKREFIKTCLHHKFSLIVGFVS